MKNRIGLIIMIIGILHSLLGLVTFSGSFAEMISGGLVNTATSLENNLAFWFTFSGFLIIFLGYLGNYLEKKNLALPKPLGWMLLAGSLLGVIILPVSGFWIVFLPAILIISKKP